MIKAIGFDLDNTLFDHSAAAGIAVELLIRGRGWQYTGESAVANEWKRIEDHFFSQYIAGNLTLTEHRQSRMREFLLSTDIDSEDHDMADLFNDYLVHYGNSWVAYPDALPALKELKSAGFKMAVLTNGQQAQQESKLLKMGLRHAFEAVLAIGTVEAIKPDPRAFAHLCQVLDCEPEEILFVGDDIDIDVRASISAGLRGVWLNRHGLPEPEGVAVQISTLADLKELLKS